METNIRKIIADFPAQFRHEVTVENSSALAGEYPLVVVCGMGGSGVVGDFLAVVYPERDIRTHKSYGLPAPKGAAKGTFYLCISYSGDTAETVSAFDEAVEKGLPVAAIAGRGRLLERAREEGVPYATVPYKKEIPSRFALGYLLTAALELLCRVRATETPGVCLAPLSQGLDPGQEERGSTIAQKLKKKTVLIYTRQQLAALGLFWKEVINETAKAPAFASSLPEAHHNEIESLAAIENLFILTINDGRGPRIDRQIKAFGALADTHGWPHETVDTKEGELITRLMNSALLALWVGTLLAEKYGADPLQTPYIQEMKSYFRSST